MYVKLNFTTNVTQKTVWRIFQDIIATAGTTSIAAFQTRANTSYHPDLKVVDYANSEIIRGVDPTGVKAMIHNQNTFDSSFNFHLRQEVHDDPGTYYYISILSVGDNQSRSYFRVGDTLTGDIAAASSIGVGIANIDDFHGSNFDQVSPIYSPSAYLGYDATFGNTITGFKAYLTNNCFMFSFNSGTLGVTGYSDSFNTTASYSGPWMFMQYKRFDHHNNTGNGIIPLIFPNCDVSHIGFGQGVHWTNPVNTTASGTGSNAAPFRAFNLINASHRIGSSYPTVYAPIVAHTVGYRSAEQIALSYEVVDTSGIYDYSTRKVIDERANYRHPTFDLNNSGYGLFPIGWSNLYLGNHGGNFTELNNVYVFNGEYQPGDELGIGEKVYTIWPGYVGYSNRFGIAIPKE